MNLVNSPMAGYSRKSYSFMRSSFKLRIGWTRKFRWEIGFSSVDVCDDEDHDHIIERWTTLYFPGFHINIHVPQDRRGFKHAKFYYLPRIKEQ